MALIKILGVITSLFVISRGQGISYVTRHDYLDGAHSGVLSVEHHGKYSALLNRDHGVSHTDHSAELGNYGSNYKTEYKVHTPKLRKVRTNDDIGYNVHDVYDDDAQGVYSSVLRKDRNKHGAGYGRHSTTIDNDHNDDSVGLRGSSSKLRKYRSNYHTGGYNSGIHNIDDDYEDARHGGYISSVRHNQGTYDVGFSKYSSGIASNHDEYDVSHVKYTPGLTKDRSSYGAPYVSGLANGGYNNGDGGYGHYNGDHGKYAGDYVDHYTNHYPKYSYGYGVDDAYTGDHKKVWETRDGDVVKGGYSFLEADGTIRVVEYTSDKHHGFNAVVKKLGQAHHPQAYGNGGYVGHKHAKKGKKLIDVSGNDFGGGLSHTVDHGLDDGYAHELGGGYAGFNSGYSYNH